MAEAMEIDEQKSVVSKEEEVAATTPSGSGSGSGPVVKKAKTGGGLKEGEQRFTVKKVRHTIFFQCLIYSPWKSITASVEDVIDR